MEVIIIPMMAIILQYMNVHLKFTQSYMSNIFQKKVEKKR